MRAGLVRVWGGRSARENFDERAGMFLEGRRYLVEGK
jgi:hypothetical protein